MNTPKKNHFSVKRAMIKAKAQVLASLGMNKKIDKEAKRDEFEKLLINEYSDLFKRLAER